MSSHAAHGHSHGHGEQHPLVGHLVPYSTLFATGGALLVLTVITVAARYIDLGEANIYLAIGIAVVKATLVSLFFMHLRWDRPFNLMVLVGSMLFVSAILGYVEVRVDNGDGFIPANAPAPPSILLASTVLLVVSSATMQRAANAGRRGDPAQGGMMLVTIALALGFLAIQAVAWRQWVTQGVLVADNLYAWTFYVLTGMHAAHVLGGLPAMAITAVKAARAAYTPDNHRGIVYCAMYWHFLDGAWIVLYATLWFGSLR